MAYEDDDDEIDPLEESAALAFASEPAARGGMDFSKFADPVTSPPSGGAKKAARSLDFSSRAEPATAPVVNAPLPRAKPTQADMFGEVPLPQARPASAPQPEPVPLPQDRPDEAPSQFDTPLSPADEAKFLKWKAVNAPNDSGADYDLRGAFKAGFQPAENGHWDDKFKKPNHPTFSVFSQYAKNRPDLAGTWDGETYIPPGKEQTAVAPVIPGWEEAPAPGLNAGPAQPSPAPAAYTPSALTRGFVSGLIESNPQMTAETLEGLSHLAPESFAESLRTGSKEIGDLAKLNPAEYKRRAGSMWDIDGIDSALTWAGETVGQGIASSVPSLVTGVGGAVMGSRMAGKTGAVVGGLGGAAIPSAVLNYGEVYKALKDEKVDPKLAAEYALYGTGPMVLLDTASIGPIVARLGGLDVAKRELARGMAKRIAVEAAKGTAREGITEAMQEMVKDATVSLAADKPFWTAENAKSWIESGVGGALTGGAMGGAGGIVQDQTHAPAPRSSPEDIAGFADAASRAPGAPPPGPSDTRAQMDEFLRRKAAGESYNDKTGEWTAPATQAPQQAEEPASEPNVSAMERRVLRKKGYNDDQIDGMSRPEAEAELGEAAEQGVQEVQEAAPDFSQHGVPADGAGTRESPAAVNDALDVARAESHVNTEPSEAQKEAGNYKKGHVKIGGLNVTIENPKGAIRSGTDANGQPWQSQMPAAYGYIKKSKGSDGDQVDVYLGPQVDAQQAFVVDQIDPATGKFDEHKLLVGFPDQASAEAAYDAAFSDGSGPARRGAVTPASLSDIKGWLRSGKTKTPFAKPVEQQQPAAAAIPVDQPTAEPASDIESQVRDLADKNHERKAVWLPAATVEHLRSIGKLDEATKSGVVMDNFDDQGGILIAKNNHVARTARKLKTQKVNLQAIVGGLTGDGLGKPPNAQTVVQQTDQAGNVTQETAVAPGEGQAVAAEMQQPGREVQELPVADALAQRDAKVASEASFDAYHGSAHDFDRFKLGHIGTGEGNHTFGYGLYFAENPSVASDYSRKLGEGGGNVYRVRIPANRENFLNWDKRLSEQSASVQAAIAAISKNKEVRLRIEGLGHDPSALDIYGAIGRGLTHSRWRGSSKGGTQADIAASKALDKAGVPGIKYLDKGSRTDGEGTRNYVLFSDKGIEIAEKAKPDFSQHADVAAADEEIDDPKQAMLAGLKAVDAKEPISDKVRKRLESDDMLSGTGQPLISGKGDKTKLTPLGRKWLTTAKKGERERAERNDKLNRLPDPSDIPALTTAYVKAVDDYDAAIRKADREAATALDDQLELLEERANGNTRSGVRTVESPAHQLRMAAAAPIGEVPKWGADGVFMLDVDGTRYIVTHTNFVGDAIYAVDGDKPFPSGSGYSSMSGGLGFDGIKGKTVDQVWTEKIEDYISSEHPADKKPKRGEVAGMPMPETWYRLPKSWDEDGDGRPVAAGGKIYEYKASGQEEADTKRGMQASDSDETVNVTLSKDGPWDFNDTWPDLNHEKVAAQESEGRSLFSEANEDGSYDAEQVSSVLDETLNSMMSDFATLRKAGKLLQKARSGEAKPPKKLTAEKWIKQLKGDIAVARRAFSDTAAALEEYFDDNAVRAMKVEARRRILQEEKSSEQLDEKDTNDLEKQRTEPSFGKLLVEPFTIDTPEGPVTARAESQMSPEGYADIYKKPGAVVGFQFSGGPFEKGAGRQGVTMSGDINATTLRALAEKIIESLKAEKSVAAAKVKKSKSKAEKQAAPAKADKNGAALAEGDTVEAVSIGGQPFKGKIKRFEVGLNNGEPAALVISGRGKSEGHSIHALKRLVKSEPDNATSLLADKFAEHLRDGNEFNNILVARKMAKEAGFEGDAKAVEEAMELAVVKLGREIAAGTDDAKAKFVAMVDLYSRQPKLGTRTSTSMRDQAFSTPIPLAYVASRLADITKVTGVSEPTAGNGALLIEANPQHTFANEINPARAENLRTQGFKVTTHDASVPFKLGTKVDVVIANPPFGAVRQEDESKVFDLSAIQKGYKTKEIDHAIALQALENLANDGRAVLLVGGVGGLHYNPQYGLQEKRRSDAYNGKAKREFYKVLYDRYNVTDHFTTSGDLWGRQGAGWPVDVIVIDGRGKSKRALPAVDVPRVLSTWDQLGGLIDANAVSGRSLEQADGDAVGTADGRSDERDVGVRSGGERVSEPDATAREPGSVQSRPADRSGDEQPGGEGQGRPAGTERGKPERVGGESPAERRPPGLDDFDSIFTDALDQTFGAQVAPKSSVASGERSTRDVAKSAAKNAAESADAAMAGLVQMFGGGKTLGSGPAFDEQTYAKAKPLFEQAASKFSAFKDDIAELVKRMVGEMQRLHGLTRDALEAMRPYLRRFMEELQAKPAVKPAETPVAKSAATEIKAEQETAQQVTYTPQSAIGNLGTLVPVNMRTPISESLAELQGRVGDLDTYVADELGYTANELPGYFAAEQIDALALAIDNIKRGKGFIIGDQTGIGKGRVNAAIIRWAMKNERIPVFVTEKPNLYRDMYRDLSDIGIQKYLDRDPRIVATNSGLTIPLTEDGEISLTTGNSSEHGRLLGTMTAKKFADKFDMVFTTYSQMQTVKGEETTRRAFLTGIAPKSVLIFDESHNAGGQGKGAYKVKGPTNRSGFARELVQTANGVFYSSATYAKRPDVMDLYSATDMVMAVEKVEDLAEAIARGGVPMQQVVASMLAKGGQYIRRERSFAGVTYDTPVVPADKEQYDGISQALALIQDFSVHVGDAAKNLDQEIKAQAQAISGDNATGSAGASSVLFTSIMHNIINQMLLAIKSGPVAQKAIEAIKAGQKPVITVANTMESFLSDFADAAEIKHGDVLNADFSDVLKKYLDRTRTLILKKPFSDTPVERKYLSDAELGRIGLAAYTRAKEAIDSVVLSDLPVSPIDRIKQDLMDAGYRVGEITGRGTVLDYSGDEPVLRSRPGKETSIRGRIATNAAFNSGELDAIVLNQAGATGISLHASKTFKDQRQRHMMIAQAEANIDTHMQMLGRVHRTGQVMVPYYSQLVADIPAEKRPAAVLAKKMASLNANTTASRGGALTSKDVPDFLNEYGDTVAATIIADDPLLNMRLGNPVKIDDETGRITVEDAMRRLTGRIPLLPLKDQEELYQRLEEDYASLLEQMEASGENALEAQTLDFKARPLERVEVVPAKKGSKSPFAAPVFIEKTSIARQGKSFSAEELVKKLLDELGSGVVVNAENAASLLKRFQGGGPGNYGFGGIAYEKARTARETAIEEFSAYQREVLTDIDDAVKQDKERTKQNAVKDRWSPLHEMLPTGARITLKTNSGNITGIVIKTERTGATKNPLALSSWKATFAVADAARQVTLPFSRLYQDGKSPSEDKTSVELRQVGWEETPEQTIERFAEMQNSAREVRNIATGNLLAAYDWLNMRGRIINYTDEAGHIRQGILTAKDFDVAEHFSTKATPIRDPADIVAWLKNNNGKVLWSSDDIVRINLEHGRFYITTEAAKRTGGVYFLDKELTDITRDFYKRGGTMVAETYQSRDSELQKIIERLQALGASFVDQTKSKLPPSEKIAEAKPDEMASVARLGEPTFDSPRDLTPAAHQRRNDLENALTDLVRAMIGPNARVAFSDTIPVKGTKGWGSAGENATTAAGVYTPAEGLIRLALNDPAYPGSPVPTAFHEAFHALEDRLLTEQELEILKRETPRLRKFLNERVDSFIQGSTETKAGWADDLAGYEVRAIAFETYASNRARGRSIGGMHIGVRRIFNKLMQLFERIRNALKGFGFQSAEDIFTAAYDGAMSGRSFRRKGETQSPQTSIRRRAPRAGDIIPAPESVREAWDPTVPFRQRLSDAFDALMLTPSRALWDRQIDLLRFQKASEAMRGPVGESLDVYLAATLYPGKVGERMKDVVKALWEPVYDAMKERGIGRDELHDYLYARHAPERNAEIRKIDPANDAGSGITDAEAATTMGSLLPRRADFEHVAALVDKIVVANRNVMLREGLESSNTIDAWDRTYQHYVPLKGFESGTDDEMPGSPSSGRGFDVRRPESMRALGRFDRADDILTNLLDQTQRTIIRAEKNKVAKTFLRFAQGNPSPFYKLGLAEKKRRINDLTGLVEEYWSNLPTNMDRVFAAKVGGKTHYIEIMHDGLLEALKTLGADKMNPFLRVMARLTREYSRFQTAKNPEFVFTNIVRDLQDAGFSISAEQHAKYTRRFYANIVNGKALYGAILGTSETGASSPYRRWFEEWREAGGKISHYGLKDFEQLRKEVEQELGQRTESTGKTVAMTPLRMVNPINGKIVKFLEALSDVTESTTRLAIYISGREIGLTKAEAARMSRNATVDFNRRGKYGSVFSSLYAFAGANIQGNIRLLRVLRKSKIARRAAMGLVIAGMLMAFWNMAMSPEDDEKKRAYEKRKYWERERNIIIYGPGTKTAIKIPLGYGLNVFWMMGEQLAMRMLGKVKTGEAIGNVLGTMIDAFNPTGSQGSFFDLATWARGLFPTVLRPAVELPLNKNWAGNAIHPDEMPWNRGLPHSSQHKAFTHPAAVNTAEFLNRLTGGNKFQPGAASLYPDDVEYGWNFAVGGLGRFLANTSGTISDAIDGVERPVERIPFVRRFVASDNSPAIQSSAYYDKRRDEQNKAQQLRSAIKARTSGEDDGSADSVIEKLGPELGARPGRNGRGINVPSDTVFRESDKQIKALRQQEDGIRKDTTLSRADRATQIGELREQMREIMGNARAAVPSSSAP